MKSASFTHSLPEAKTRGYAPGRFSFNVKGGRCEACEGNGSNKLEMDFLADVWVTCPVCEGHRFNRETLQVKYRDKSIADVLEMDVQQAIEFFENIPKVLNKLKTLHAVGLDYLKIGQPSPTLSGRRSTTNQIGTRIGQTKYWQTLYMLDEPTTGCILQTSSCCSKFCRILSTLETRCWSLNTILTSSRRRTGSSISVPEGGSGGGQTVVCAGTPEAVAANNSSLTPAKRLKTRQWRTSPIIEKPKSKKKTKPVYATQDQGSWSATTQPEKHRCRCRSGQDDRFLRAQWQRQKLDGDGYDLCRRAAAIR